MDDVGNAGSEQEYGWCLGINDGANFLGETKLRFSVGGTAGFFEQCVDRNIGVLCYVQAWVIFLR